MERSIVKEPAKIATSGSFLERNEFLLRRLHSLSGIVPVGAYMVVHLVTNASVLDGPATFQRNVYSIHSLGAMLPLVEWVFIFLPLIYHAVYGVLITRGALPNSGTYKTTSNVRYTLQRATGMIAFVFIFWHVFHMHGWFHADAWMQNVAEPLGGGKFRAYNASSTAAEAMQMSLIVPILYAIGVLSCVFHLANGIWTFGITWGLWVTPRAQRWATAVCLVFGLGLAAVSMGALHGFTTKSDMRGQENITRVRAIEDRMYEERLKIGEIDANEHKRKRDEERDHERTQAAAAFPNPSPQP
jgi:succinate dehydrogenase / fumarate reductase, cytochrome b subunit